MNPVYNTSVIRNAVRSSGLPVYSASRPSGSLELFDKNGRSMGEASAHTPAQVYQSLLHPGAPGLPDYTMIQAVIRKTDGKRLLISDLLKQDVIMALGAEKGIVVRRQPNGDIIFYCMVLQMQDRLRIAGAAPSNDDMLRHFLKSCYAGWHHVYHELFATATDFSAVPVCNTAIDELLRQIQAPLRFPA